MRLHAYIKSSHIEKLEEISESKWTQDINSYDAIIDIHDTIPRPMVGWRFNSSLQFESSQPLSSEQSLSLQQTSQRLYGFKLAEELTDMIGTRNLFLASQGSAVNVTALLQALGGIKGLLETGALKTARGIVATIAPAYPAYQDILELALSKMTSFLQDNGWD